MTITPFPYGLSSFGIPVMPGLGSGIGIGNVFWVVQTRASSNLWYEQLRQMVDDATIFTSLQAAHNACTSNQSDTIFITPGVYTITAETELTKNHINYVGTAGPNNQMTYATTRDMSSVTIYTVTAAVPSTVHVAGHRNNFYGISFVNNGAAATNLQAMRICAGVASNNAYGNYFYRCTFHGVMNTSQNTAANCSLNIGSGASNYMFEECIIGQNTFGGARATAGQGHLFYPGVYETGGGGGAGYAPQNGIFRRCLFLSRGTTVTVPMVLTATGGTEALDRLHLFEQCIFANYSGVDASMAKVFDDTCGTWHNIVLKGCTAVGYDEWQTADLGTHPGYISADMPITGVAGGHTRMPTGAHDSGT